ncbi:hypothetical protein [Paenibacillus periandrae]|uniref:hypothetical protein n=1 Tax=Paenibacillus periandrae TaxID=1761741 RepID=UPI001F09EEA5|nr:hypothetical protein [Paenibacillus periandrae]
MSKNNQVINGEIRFKESFAPTGSDYMKYEGLKFTVIRQLEAGKEFDKTDENPRMYVIRLENDEEVHVFNDEIEI